MKKLVFVFGVIVLVFLSCNVVKEDQKVDINNIEIAVDEKTFDIKMQEWTDYNLSNYSYKYSIKTLESNPAPLVANIKITNNELKKENIDWLQFGVNKKEDFTQENWREMCESVDDWQGYSITSMFEKIKEIIKKEKQKSDDNSGHFSKIELEYGNQIPYIKRAELFFTNSSSHNENDDIDGGVSTTVIEISDFSVEE